MPTHSRIWTKRACSGPAHVKDMEVLISPVHMPELHADGIV